MGSVRESLCGESTLTRQHLNRSQIASPAGARAAFVWASPVCPVLAQSGQSMGFDRACTGICAGPARVARSSPHEPIKIPPGARTGYAWANICPFQPAQARTHPYRDLYWSCEGIVPVENIAHSARTGPRRDLYGQYGLARTGPDWCGEWLKVICSYHGLAWAKPGWGPCGN